MTIEVALPRKPVQFESSFIHFRTRQMIFYREGKGIREASLLSFTVFAQETQQFRADSGIGRLEIVYF